jgi:hypothetical protein
VIKVVCEVDKLTIVQSEWNTGLFSVHKANVPPKLECVKKICFFLVEFLLLITLRLVCLLSRGSFAGRAPLKVQPVNFTAVRSGPNKKLIIAELPPPCVQMSVTQRFI